VGVRERTGVHPPFAVDDQPAQQRDVRRRATEPGDADPRPLPGDGANATLCRASAHREYPSPGGLEELDWVARGIVEQDLLAAGSTHDVIAKREPG
jgi:hypothetical protein